MVSIEDVFEKFLDDTAAQSDVPTVVSDTIPTDDFFSWLNHQPAYMYRNICF
jgi:hypothetical protein